MVRRFIPILLAGCVSAAPEPPAYDPCAPLVLAAAADATPDERASLGQAIALWKATSDARVTTDEVAGAPRLEVHFRDAPLAFLGVYEEAGIAVNRGLVDRGARAVVLAHELGHAFGLAHAGDPASVMRAGNLSVPPGVVDAAALQALWGACAQADGVGPE
jgi:hypothetical protein